MTRWGVLLLGFGGPRNLDEVRPFLEKLLGRVPPTHVEDEVRQRYRLLGGGSPLAQTTLRQGELLAALLKERGHDWPVSVGMAYARPSVAEGVARLAEAGARRIVLLPLTPYRARVSWEAYEREARETLAARKEGMEGYTVREWHDHPRYVQALSRRLRETLAEVPEEERKGVPVIFTAHSLPVSMVEQGDPYVRQLEGTILALDGALGPLNWRLGFQSRSLGAREPWLGPEIEQVLTDLRAQGHRRVVVHPIGFVSDHVETLYDNDRLHHELALRLGLDWHRVPCLNDLPEFIAALAELVEEAIAAAAPATRVP